MANDRIDSKYFTAICYLENMREDWKDIIEDALEIPFAYCVHDKDLNKDGDCAKPHVHIFMVFNNTTTQSNTIKICNHFLSKDGLKCCSTSKKNMNQRKAYDYLIHDTPNAKAQGKYQYPKSDRIECNGFDIHFIEQVSLYDKVIMKKTIAACIQEECILNFFDLQQYVADTFDEEYYLVFNESQSYFNNLVKGYYNKLKFEFTGERDQLIKYMNRGVQS